PEYHEVEDGLQPRNTLVGTIQRMERRRQGADLGVGSEAETTEPVLAVAPPPAVAAVEPAEAVAIEAEPPPAEPLAAAEAAEPEAEIDTYAAEPEEAVPPPPAPVPPVAVPARPPVGSERAVTVRQGAEAEVAAAPPAAVIAPVAPAAPARPAAIEQMAKLDPGDDFSTELRPPAPSRAAAATAELDRVEI